MEIHLDTIKMLGKLDKIIDRRKISVEKLDREIKEKEDSGITTGLSTLIEKRRLNNVDIDNATRRIDRCLEIIKWSREDMMDFLTYLRSKNIKI